MLSKEVIQKNFKNCLKDTRQLGIKGNFKQGKVRDSYVLGDRLLLITTDRQSAFDRILAHVPFKGQVLNQISAWWFKQTSDIVPNHVLAIPDPNITVAKKCKVFPIEFVVRGYLTGSTDTSVWVNYQKGVRNYCGNPLPQGMLKNQKFENPLLTPTTKSDKHDELISPDEIIRRKLIPRKTWEKLSEIAFSLFKRGTEIAAQHGLILVDTKYELGEDSLGKILLIDEIHTPDSSRYWIADTYPERLRTGQEPENIDKEFLRLWFKEHCDPYRDKKLPPAPPELVVELSWRYLKLYEMITGEPFVIDNKIPVLERIQKKLFQYDRSLF